MTDQKPDHAQIPVPPPLVYLGYLIGALVLSWIRPLPLPWTDVFRVIGGLALAAGLWLGFAAITQMRKAHTSPEPHRPVTALVIGGPYRFTRNPIYLGYLLIYLGITLLAGTPWGLIASPFLIWTVTQNIIFAEEIYLEDKFQDQYAAYKSRVRRWI